MKFSILTLLTVIGIATAQIDAGEQQGQSCQIRVGTTDWPQWPPLILDQSGELLVPNGEERIIEVAKGESVDLACSESTFEQLGIEFSTGTCDGGIGFSVSGSNYDFDQLGCVKEVNDDTRSVSGSCGNDNSGRLHDIGFNIEDGGFEDVIRVCFEESLSMVFYTKHYVLAEIDFRDKSNDRPSFKNAGFYPFDVNDAYTRVQQKATIADLVGSQDLADQYVEDTGNTYLVRGHLAPNADFMFYSQQDATFYFINVAPQWQDFNAGNWVDAENGIRRYVVDHGNDLAVYTGTSGVLQLRDINENLVDIWLYNDNGEQRLPVPRYFWKVVLDEASNTAVGIVGVNNVHLLPEEIDDYKVCDSIGFHPILADVTNPDDIEDGIIYACTYQALAQAIDEVPELGNPGLLI